MHNPKGYAFIIQISTLVSVLERWVSIFSLAHNISKSRSISMFIEEVSLTTYLIGAEDPATSFALILAAGSSQSSECVAGRHGCAAQSRENAGQHTAPWGPAGLAASPVARAARDFLHRCPVLSGVHHVLLCLTTCRKALVLSAKTPTTSPQTGAHRVARRPALHL